jgi:hypothetical protein
MEQSRLDYCCGVGEIGGFYGMNRNDADNDARLKELEGLVKARNMGAAICTTNGGQPRAASLLERNGYKVVLGFINPNSGNAVKIWLKDLTKVEG